MNKREKALRFRLDQTQLALVTAAREVGSEVRVFQVPQTPRAMGNHSTRISVYRNHAGRKAAQEAAKP